MATISNAQARYQLTAKGSLTSNSVSGSGTIGEGLGTVNFTDCDIAYAFRVTGNASSDSVRLLFSNNTAVITAGSPTTGDADGKDLEGETIPALVSLQAVFCNTSAGAASQIQINNGGTDIFDAVIGYSGKTQVIYPTPTTVTGGHIDINFGVGTSNTTTSDVTVIGKST